MMYPGAGRIMQMGWVVGLSSIQKEDNHKRKAKSRGEIIKTLKGGDNNLGVFVFSFWPQVTKFCLYITVCLLRT